MTGYIIGDSQNRKTNLAKIFNHDKWMEAFGKVCGTDFKFKQITYSGRPKDGFYDGVHCNDSYGTREIDITKIDPYTIIPVIS